MRLYASRTHDDPTTTTGSKVEEDKGKEWVDNEEDVEWESAETRRLENDDVKRRGRNSILIFHLWKVVTMVKVVNVFWKHILRRANPPFTLNLIYIKIAEKKYVYIFIQHRFYQRLIKVFNDNLDLGLHISKIIKRSIIFSAKRQLYTLYILCF